MNQLSDTQALILSAAAQRPDRIALPLPASLRGGAAAKVVVAMKRRGFLEEVEADMRNGETIWRETGDGHGVTLVATAAGLAAIGIEPEDADDTPADGTQAQTAQEANDAGAEGEVAPTARPTRTAREGTKQACVLDMLRRPKGATTAEIAEATGWQQHTVRSTLSHAIQKRLGIPLVSEQVEGRGRVHRVADEA
jgi:hypothetical protein